MPDQEEGFRHASRSFSRSKLLVELNADLVHLRQRVEAAKRSGVAARLLEKQEALIVERIRRLRLSI